MKRLDKVIIATLGAVLWVPVSNAAPPHFESFKNPGWTAGLTGKWQDFHGRTIQPAILGTDGITSSNGSVCSNVPSFVNRETGGMSPTVQTNNDDVPGATRFIIDKAVIKAGWGIGDFDGNNIHQVARLNVSRHHDKRRLGAGSSREETTDFNIWGTDRSGNYALPILEPASSAFRPLLEMNCEGSKSGNLNFSDIADKVVPSCETSNGVHKGTNTWIHDLIGISHQLNFQEIANVEIKAPTTFNLSKTAMPAVVELPVSWAPTQPSVSIGSLLTH